jgi:hypothetical protein
VESLDRDKTLPLYVRSSKSGHSLVETWQLLAGRAQIKNLLGPTEMAPKSGAAVRASAAEIRAAVRALPTDSIPSRVKVGASEVNAAEFLYLMARVALGAQNVEAPPVAVTQPVAPREERFDDPLSLLQMWTFKPAYYNRPGGRLQRDNEMRLLRPEDLPPY